MLDHGVARVNKDQAGGPIGTGAKTVFVENQKAAFVGSTIAGKPNTGDIIVRSPTTVFVENKKNLHSQMRAKILFVQNYQLSLFLFITTNGTFTTFSIFFYIM